MFERTLQAGAIGGLRLANRIVMGSMHLGIESDGAALAAFYAERARGGAGLIVTGGSCVNRAGAGGRNYSFINEPESSPPLRAAVEAVHAAGGRIALQLFHAGRYAHLASFGIHPVAPSAIASRFSPDPPRALRDDEIRETIGDFARGAARARDLGFDAVEVMASEGYLLNQFLSPLTNQRDDAWGGDLERRMRLPRAVLREIHALSGAEFPVIFRISGADLMKDSTTPDEALALARALAGDGVDALNVGIGWHESSIPTVQQVVPSGVWVPFAAAVKAAVGQLPVIASNRINSLAGAESVLAAGSVDFISMARPFLSDAQIVAKAARNEAALVNTCIACNQACIDRSLVDAPVSCMINPRAARELEFPEPAQPKALRRRFAVVGGGPAGMESARALAALGHAVELFEAEDELGGQFRMARRIPGKADFNETIRYYTNDLARLGVVAHLRRRVGDAAELRGFDGIVLAQRSVVPRRVALEGSDLPHVLTYAELLLGDPEVGERVAIVGAGGIGVDVAHYLSFGEANADETTRFLYEQGAGGTRQRRSCTGHRAKTGCTHAPRCDDRQGHRQNDALDRDCRAPREQEFTTLPTTSTTKRSCREGIRIRDAGVTRLIEADTVVIAAGQERNDALAEPIHALGIPYRVVGGAKDAAELNAVRAFDEGLRAAHSLSS